MPRLILRKRKVVKEDGRYLIFYSFDEAAPEREREKGGLFAGESPASLDGKADKVESSFPEEPRMDEESGPDS